MKNICLKVLAGFEAGESASHLSKIHSLSLDQVLECKRQTNCGHTVSCLGIIFELNHVIAMKF